jgi:uncharacterized protein YhdP
VPRWLADLRHERSLRYLGVAVLASVAVALVAGFLILAYQLTAARVPEHRAALEHLVSAETGLDLRFEELSLRWGWYGPEAVFSRVELGEPGRANALLRAPELIVAFDAWRTVQSGRLQAGRITLVAPDIDLPRYVPAAAAGAAPAAAAADSAASSAAVLERWRGGRIDFEGGTLRLADPNGSAESWAVSIRRASLSRERDRWHAQAFVVLPERLGTSAHVDLSLRGDLSDAAGLAGTVRAEGVRLVFAGWRNLLQGTPALARGLPSAGGGDVTFHADFAAGRVEKADGSVRAGGVELADSVAADHPLLLDRVRGDWRLRREGSGWHGEIDSFQVGRSQSDAAASAHVAINWNGPHLRAQATRLPLESVAAAIAWAAPQLDVGGADIDGTARDVVVDWNDSRPVGARLRVNARLEDIALAPASRAFALTGLAAQVSGDERAWGVELESGAARLEMAELPDSPLTGLRVAAHLNVSRSGAGWRVASDELSIIGEHSGRLQLSGSVSAPRAGSTPIFQIHGAVADVDVALLQKLWGDELQRRFGAAASNVTAGRIEDAHFVLTAAGSLTGALALADATVSDGHGLDAQGVAAHIDWTQSGISAVVARGHAGPLQLGPMQLAWRADGKGVLEVGGHARGRLENTLAWVHDHPQLRAYVPEVRGLSARGEALFDFDLAIPADALRRPASAQRLPRARVAVFLEEATVQTGPGVPPLESVRGALAFDGGHLQRSLLTARWLGGPVTLRLAERPGRRAGAFSVKAQGLMDVRELAALGTVADPSALDGDAEWSGDFLLDPQSSSHPAQWQARLDATLTGVTSRLPEPLTKAAGVAAPLHVDIAGSSERAELHLALADRLHSVFEIAAAGDDAWRVERGSVRFGGTGPVQLAAEPAVVLSGKLARLDPTPYLAAWNRAGRELLLPRVSGGVFVSELKAAGDVYSDANLRVHRSGGTLALQIEPYGADQPGT